MNVTSQQTFYVNDNYVTPQQNFSLQYVMPYLYVIAVTSIQK
jgi:hypothetical protein